ncbi:pantoate--beta-alanine ligase [Methylococcus sp. EFPC2]|uniref:pantoate--beta-alanine ligase n=1 Tax=Methylococcus sp. EFPC2 TaxID=2812648 RepID=UPI0019675FF0|nr:pantoate--beta-alanine ligase [Methylococcus sp. EFPC2]QSA98249.1 pantoate--beta-alanine ligase [Methylococcus sp. EFPC2]
MQTVNSVAELRTVLRDWRKHGETIAFVPTMGNLHAGHLRLVEEGRKAATRVVVSIFVNPTQFGPGEDFAAYPRTPAEDAEKLRAAQADLLFLPAPAELYPAGLEGLSYVDVPGLSEELCGRFRPGHFRGVATVVCKLFNLVQPDVALFGEKDYQQLAVIRRMVADLNMSLDVVGVPTVREESGLALSSRNGYLSEEEKHRAASLYRCLQAAGEFLRRGRRDYAAIETEQARALESVGFLPDYFAIRRVPDLGLPDTDEQAWVVLAAAKLGKTRLIDNLQVRI